MTLYKIFLNRINYIFIKGMVKVLELIFRLLHELMFLAGYVGNGNAFPKQLSAQEERKCLELFQKGDMDARNTLVEHNLRLVAHITKKYSNEYNSDDLISVGIIGLIKGINTFNPKKNTRIASYISRCIEKPIHSQRLFLN